MKPDDKSFEILKLLFTVFAVVISIISILISFRQNKRTAKTGIRPILTFLYDGDKGWMIRNVGSGPAMDIIVGQRTMDGWFNPVRIPPLAKDRELVLTWLNDVNDTSLGAEYLDFEERLYGTFCFNDLSKIFQRRIMPEWDEKEISRHWKQRLYKSEEYHTYDKRKEGYMVSTDEIIAVRRSKG